MNASRVSRQSLHKANLAALAEEVHGGRVGALLAELGFLQDARVLRVDGLGGKLEKGSAGAKNHQRSAVLRSYRAPNLEP